MNVLQLFHLLLEIHRPLIRYPPLGFLPNFVAQQLRHFAAKTVQRLHELEVQLQAVEALRLQQHLLEALMHQLLQGLLAVPLPAHQLILNFENRFQRLSRWLRRKPYWCVIHLFEEVGLIYEDVEELRF